jgi:hypothetical protein
MSLSVIWLLTPLAALGGIFRYSAYKPKNLAVVMPDNDHELQDVSDR